MLYQIDDFEGVDAEDTTPLMMIPQGDYNLIVHDNGPNPPVKNNNPGVRIRDLTDDLKQSVSASLQSLAKFVGKPLDSWRATALLSTAAHMNLGGRKRLIAITSNLTGNYALNIGANALDVWVRARLSFKLSFWYYQYTGTKYQDQWNAMNGGLDSNAHSRYAVDGLNKYFVDQANIAFERRAANDWKTDTWLDATHFDKPAVIPNIGRQGAREYQSQNEFADSGADFRIFVVPTVYVQGGALGMTDPPPWGASWVTWIFSNNVPRTSPNADLFIPNLAHELVHAFGKEYHFERARVMCNNHAHSLPDEELLIDKNVLDIVNPFHK